MNVKTLKKILKGLEDYEVVFEVLEEGKDASEASFGIDEVIVCHDFVVLRSKD